MSQSKEVLELRLWASFATAIGAELRPGDAIKGKSGIEHKAQALAFDEAGKRIIVISSEQDARVAALVQSDIQALHENYGVILARPIIFDLGAISRQIISVIPPISFTMNQLSGYMEYLSKLTSEEKAALIDGYGGNLLKSLLLALQNVSLPPLPQVMGAIGQVSRLPLGQLMKNIGDKDADIAFAVRGLAEIDNLENDRKYGVCPIPLYELSNDDWELFLSGSDADSIAQRLLDLDIYQYFFPSPDHVALGLVDRGIASEQALVEAVSHVPALGHPFGNFEILKSPSALPKLLQDLKSSGYVAEGEMGIEISAQGQNVRSIVKFRPRESILSKILNRISFGFSVNPKDFI
jgi:hypothetical protein